MATGISTQLVKTTDNATVFVGNRVYLGTKSDYKINDTETGLVHEYSILKPIMVRTVDNNKYDEPHQSTKEKTRRIKQRETH